MAVTFSDYGLVQLERNGADDVESWWEKMVQSFKSKFKRRKRVTFKED